MGIAQGATPYLLITVEGYDLSDAVACTAAIKTGDMLLVLGLDRITITSDGTDSLLTVLLTQEETLSMTPTKALIQIRWRDPNERSHTTLAAQFDVASALYKGVI